MIHILRKKLIGATMVSLTLVLLIILGAVNAVSFHKTAMDADRILYLLSENQGAFPKQLNPGMEDREPQRGQRVDRPFGRMDFSPETPFESRFFSVTVDEAGSPVFTDIANIAAIDSETAQQYAADVLSSGKPMGFKGNYR